MFKDLFLSDYSDTQTVGAIVMFLIMLVVGFAAWRRERSKKL